MNTASTPASAEFFITRVFDAPRERVWQAFSEADRLVHWWGPKGFTIRIEALDFRPDGVFHYAMQMPGAPDMWGKFVYREIRAPEALVWLNSFSDEHGGVTRHPMSPDWPLRMLVSVAFTEEDGKTRLALRSVAFEATEAECRVFEAGIPSMTAGFGGTFDQLADYLALAQ